MSSEALRLKEAGNAAIKDHHYTQAVDLYTKGIEALTEADEKRLHVILLSNRAQANLKSEAYGAALSDADAVLALDPKFIKGYFRKGSALFAMQKFGEARKLFHRVCKLVPKDKSARFMFQTCDREYRREAFEAAIESEHTKSIWDIVPIDDVTVPADYAGPRLQDDASPAWTPEWATAVMSWFEEQKKLPIKYVYVICRHVFNMSLDQPSLVDIRLEEGKHVTVCGDTHGQYYDVLNLFKLNGLPSPQNPYLFNGDFVDRGSFSCEVALTLLIWKCVYPEHVHLARGNHETKNMNHMYGFEGEVKAKYDGNAYDMFTEVFNVLPLAHCLQDKVFVVHGGLFADDNVTLDDLRALKRQRQPPQSGNMSDMLWADPQDSEGRAPSKRGVGLSFGPDVTKSFLERNGLELLVRSHEVKEEGYEIAHDGKCITVFSAPNYCDQIGNKGAYIRFVAPEMKPDIHQFEAVEHPTVPPMAYASAMSRFGI